MHIELDNSGYIEGTMDGTQGDVYRAILRGRQWGDGSQTGADIPPASVAGRRPSPTDRWIGTGGSISASFAEHMPRWRNVLEVHGRGPDTFSISKRGFLLVHERTEVARAKVHRWYSEMSHTSDPDSTGGVYRTQDQVREPLETIAAMGTNHLLINPTTRFPEQVEARAEIVD